MAIIVIRDQAFDSALESEARLTLILVGVGLAFLFFVTAVIFYFYPVYRVLRRTFCFRSQVQNSTAVETFQPVMTSTPDARTLRPSAVHTPPQRRDVTSSTHRSPAIFGANFRKYPSVPHRPTAVYSGMGTSANGLYNHPGNLRPGFRPDPTTHPGMTTPPSPSPHCFVTPHIAGWMRVADSVVGRHPDAQPLSTRVATQAEIDLISGHVHIPWAFKKNEKKTTPTPVKVQKPVTQQTVSQTPGKTTDQGSRGKSRVAFLHDMGNIRGGRDALTSLGRPADSDGTPKIKAASRKPRGKENTPPGQAGPSKLGQRNRSNYL